MRNLTSLITLGLFGILAAGCASDSSTFSSSDSPVSITRTQVSSTDILVTGDNLNLVNKVSLASPAQDFDIVSQSSNSMIIKPKMAITLIAGQIYNLIFESAQAAVSSELIIVDNLTCPSNMTKVPAVPGIRSYCIDTVTNAPRNWKEAHEGCMNRGLKLCSYRHLKRACEFDQDRVRPDASHSGNWVGDFSHYNDVTLVLYAPIFSKYGIGNGCDPGASGQGNAQVNAGSQVTTVTNYYCCGE